MAKKGILTRDLLKQEFSWLVEDLEKDKVVYRFSGCTYGLIGRNGIAVSDKPDEDPFYEIPKNAVDWEK